MKLILGGECFVCGDDLVLRTNAPQDCQMDHDAPHGDHCKKEWYAYDGDDVVCAACGAKGYVSCDGEGSAYVDYDETSEHNVKCFQKWEAQK